MNKIRNIQNIAQVAVLTALFFVMPVGVPAIVVLIATILQRIL